MDDPLCRPCRYCRVPFPCDVHAVDCPSNTNLWPVQARDIGAHGFCCFDCGTPFAVGEFYVQRPYAESAVAVACLSCAAAAMVGGVER